MNQLTHIIVTAQGYWAKGLTLAEARANYCIHSGRKFPKTGAVYKVSEATRINEYGSLVYPKGDAVPELQAN